MNLLLDTHTTIWFLEGDVQLSQMTQTAIESLENQSFLSVVRYLFWHLGSYFFLK